jgi:hypothetical protein
VLGLSTALQFVVFGTAIAAGMVISGDRIVGVFGGMLQRQGAGAWMGGSTIDTGGTEKERREHDGESE